MLNIKCETCGETFWVKGYTTPNGFYEPGEVVTECESNDELCKCLTDGGAFEVIGEEFETFDDDVM